MKKKEREISEIGEIESIVKKADVCRVAMSNNDVPYIVTMNFGYSDRISRRLWFHCAAEGRKLDMIRKNNLVCFELDTDHQLFGGEKACDFGMKYSSVVGWGRIEILTDNNEKIEGLNYIMAHYSDRTGFSYRQETLDKTVVLRLDIIEMSGKAKR
ncbi:MAG: pyridoxamine 5'-phosphate oxidase family protein [Bacteroidota bacterium]|nr:pyridoxamine 5'-phosphate oxidase family protein [Bacteroidota bacterium]